MNVLYQNRQKLKILALGIALGVPLITGAAEHTAGHIVLQVEQNGEAWYIHPHTQRRHALGRPAEAFAVLRETGLGISNADLSRISVGLTSLPEAADADDDGLPDRLETALGTNSNARDTDGDGFSDATELVNGYDPVRSNGARLSIDTALARRLAGRIVLQVESRGEAWYIDPKRLQRHYLGTPAETLAVMRSRGLGISNADLAAIPVAPTATDEPTTNTSAPQQSTPSANTPPTTSGANTARTAVANAIAANNLAQADTYVSDDMTAALQYTLGFLDASGRTTLAELLSEARANGTTTTSVVYETSVPFNGETVAVTFTFNKNNKETWQLTSL